MSTATFADLGFRDVAGRLIVVECPLLERLGKAGISVPAGADAVLAYVYVDHEQGGLSSASPSPTVGN